jgi:hypothetical protein
MRRSWSRLLRATVRREHRGPRTVALRKRKPLHHRPILCSMSAMSLGALAQGQTCVGSGSQVVPKTVGGLKPHLQRRRQRCCEPKHSAPSAFAGTGQGVHLVPHVFTSPEETHLPPQKCWALEGAVPPGHMHDRDMPISYLIVPLGQVKSHLPPVQTAVPSAGAAGQALQLLPHDETLLSLLH